MSTQTVSNTVSTKPELPAAGSAQQITRLPAPLRRGKRQGGFLAPDAVKDHIRSLLPGPEGLIALLGLGAIASRSGSQIVMCCPAHADITPSFGIDVVGGRVVYHCFGCRIAGDVFGLVALGSGLDCHREFPSVLDAAARLVGYSNAEAVRMALSGRGGAR